MAYGPSIERDLVLAPPGTERRFGVEVGLPGDTHAGWRCLRAVTTRLGDQGDQRGSTRIRRSAEPAWSASGDGGRAQRRRRAATGAVREPSREAGLVRLPAAAR